MFLDNAPAYKACTTPDPTSKEIKLSVTKQEQQTRYIKLSPTTKETESGYIVVSQPQPKDASKTDTKE